MPKRTNAFWFFVAFLGGGGGIWWTKIAFDNAWITAIVAAGVVLALAVYYVFNDENAPEEEGDNVYYLGLLFTLVSLMFTIVELFGGDTDVVRDADNIRVLLENFGIALTSTVVGIAGRVAVQNWQRAAPAGRPESVEDPTVPVPASASPRDLERFNRHLLGRIARDLTQGANALARFHRIVRSHASDTENHLHNHTETLKRETAAFEDRLRRNAETFAQELNSQASNTLDAVGSAFGATAKQAEGLLERLQSVQESYLAEVREVTRSFHDEIRSTSGQSLDAVRRNFDAAAKQSLSLTQNVSTLHERIGEVLDRLGSGLGHASEPPGLQLRWRDAELGSHTAMRRTRLRQPSNRLFLVFRRTSPPRLLCHLVPPGRYSIYRLIRDPGATSVLHFPCPPVCKAFFPNRSVTSSVSRTSFHVVL